MNRNTEGMTLKKNSKHRLLRNIRRSWVLYLLVFPAVLYLALFHYAPMYGIQIAFRNFTIAEGVTASKWVGLKWFKYLFKSAQFLPIVRNTFLLSFYSLATFPLPIIFALILHNLPNERIKKFAQTATYLPHFISIVVVVGMIYSFTSYNSGWINTLIESLGGTRVSFTTDNRYYRHLFVWTGVWQEVGWNSIIYLAALTGVSPELHEAAIIDGATKFQRIINIDLPSIAPTIVIMLIMRCGSIMTISFDKSYLMQNSLNLAVSEVLSTYSYKMGMLNAKYSYSAAISLITNTVNFVFLTVVNRIAKAISGNSLW